MPDANRLGEEGKGFRVAMSALDKGRMSIAAGCVGIARGCLEAATGYAKQRVQFGKPIAGHQLVQELLADTAVDVDAGRMLTWLVADLLDRGRADRAWPRPRRSCSPARPRSGRRTTACRSSAATATSTSTRSASTCATPG